MDSGHLKMFLRKPEVIRLAIFIALLHALFFLFALNSNNIYLSVDSREYLHQVENLKHHFSWYAGDWNKPHEDFLETRRPPAYAFFIAFLRLFSASDFLVLFVQNILSIINLLLTCFLVSVIMRKQIINYVFVIALLLFPTQLIYANMIMADVLFQTFLLLAVFFFYRFSVERKTIFFFNFNLMIAFAVLTKPVMYLFPILILVLCLLWYSKKMLQLKDVFFVTLPVLVVLALCFYNYRMTGLFHYSSVNQKFLSEYGAYLSVGERGDADAQFKIDSILSKANKMPDFKSYSVFINEASNDLIKQNLGRFLWMQSKGMVQFFVDHGRWDLYAFFVNPDHTQLQGWKYFYQKDGLAGVWFYLKGFNVLLIGYLVLITLMNVWLLFALLRFFLNTTVNYNFRLLIACLVFYQVALTSVVGCSRYRMAIYPFLLMSAAIVVNSKEKKNVLLG